MDRICIQWPRFGPYYLARLQATHRYLQDRGVELVGLETASNDATYAWRVERGRTPFRRETVFPGRTFDDISPQEMFDAVTARLDALQPDAVAIHSYSFPDARACLTWCRTNRRVAIIMTDSQEDDAPRVGWRERIKQVLVRQYDAAVVAGTPQRAYLEKLGMPPGHIFYGYDVVDNDYFANAAEAVRADPQAWREAGGEHTPAPFFLAVSRFLPYKNLDGLLHAYRDYRGRTHTPWPLVVVGDGPERARLETLVADLQLEGCVALPGFVQVDRLPGYYALAGALVHPSFRDTWGLVINEAMATGLPVLVSDRAGCAQDLVDPGRNGHRFDPSDLARLADLLTELSAPTTDRAALGEASRQLIADWSLERFAASIWQAAQVGRTRADRGMHPVARGAVSLLRLVARDIRAFQALPE